MTGQLQYLLKIQFLFHAVTFKPVQLLFLLCEKVSPSSERTNCESFSEQSLLQPFGIPAELIPVLEAINSPVLVTSPNHYMEGYQNKKEKGNYKKTTHTHTNLQAIQSTLRHNPCQGYLISVSEVLTSWGCGRRCRAAWRTQNNVWLERKSFSKQLEGVDWLVTDFWQSCNNIPALLSSHQHYKHTAYLNEWKLLCVWESASVSLLHMRFRNVYLPSEVKISFLHPSSLCFLLQISDIV